MTFTEPDVNWGTEPPFPLPAEEAHGFLASFPHWYHRIYIGNGIYTLGGRGYHEEVWSSFAKALPPSLTGLSVLDVGTNAGYFALQAKLRGATRVIGTEAIKIYWEQAEAIRKIWGLEVDYRVMDAHEMTKLGQRFDLVVFAGILYHLKNPLQVLEDIGSMCSDAILLETEFIPDDPLNCVVVRQGVPATLRPAYRGIMKFMETTELNGDSTNWWVPDTECVMGMLRTAGFTYISEPVIKNGCRLCLVASKRKDSLLRIEQFGD